MLTKKLISVVCLLYLIPSFSTAAAYEDQWHVRDWVGGFNINDPMIPVKIDRLTDNNQLRLTQAYVTCSGIVRVVNGVAAGAFASVEFGELNSGANAALWPIVMVHAGTTFGADGTPLSYSYIGEVKGSYRIRKPTVVRVFAGGNRVRTDEPNLTCQYDLYGEFERR